MMSRYIYIVIFLFSVTFLSAQTDRNVRVLSNCCNCVKSGVRNIDETNSISNPKFMSHRGLQSLGPENSLTSFRAAADKGVWAIETDFRITADGKVVCVHDKTLDRTTTGKGPVSDMTLEQLRKLEVLPVNTKTVVKKYDYEQIPNDEKAIPTMEEYLQICRAAGCIAFVELKEDRGVIDAMISAIAEYGMSGRCIISSGKIELLQRYRAAGGQELIHLIFAKPEQLQIMRQLGNASVSFKIADLDAPLDMNIDGVVINSLDRLVEHIHASGLRICFRAADSEAAARKHISLGTDFIPTNVMY